MSVWKRLAGWLAITATVALGWGCKTDQEWVKISLFEPTLRPATTGRIDVYQAGDRPTNAVTQIALMTFPGEMVEETRALNAFISRARQLGADVVILQPSQLYDVRRKPQVVFRAIAAVSGQ